MGDMSDNAHEHIPALTLGWRLKMALGDMPAHEMADALNVVRGTVSRWMADKGTPPRAIYIRQWALITRTDPTWLLTGQVKNPRDPSRTSPAYFNYQLALAA